ncbi:PREDICTED: little elongation complex subunit 2-like [Branchiostoma belcheri]|uniref:Little elongation complex subunit 2-like n=1 Tax=Branchiostoma belcheri TaxID=7741 RepID=A0A6P5A8N2_BRABE|nr:PREDICTED: little elongation complex subunit 2-like [Branchiostoma belcheri]
MELNWDAPLLNGRQSFFTETRYNQFSIAPTFTEVLEDSLPPEVKERLRREAAETSERIPTQAEVQNVQATAVQQPSAASKPPATSATKKPAVTSANIKPPALNVLGKPPSSYPVPRIPFPRLSTLMHGEQKTYMELFRKYQFYNPARPPGPIEMREIQQFRDLQMKVGPEQEEFMRYLEFVATQSPQDYSFMQPQAKKYIQEVLTANNRSIPMMGYPQFYKVYQTVGISTVGFKTDPVMRHVKTLLEMGSVPGLKLPKANETAKVLPSYEEIVDHKPVNIPAKVDKNTSQKVVSEDENAQKLAAKYGAHIVLSASALCTLLDNHAPHYQEQWELPVTVKESTSTGDSTCTTKTVVIDKPLPKKNITAREKNTLFHSIALELFLTDKGASTVLEKLRSDRYTATDIHNLHVDAPSDEMEPSSSIEKDMQRDDTKEKMGRTCQERKEEDLLGNNQDLADLETFGEGSRRRITKKTSAKMQTVQTTKISQEKEESQHVETHTVDTNKSRDIDDQCKEIENTSSQMEVTDNEGKPLVEAEDHVEKLESTKNEVTTSAQVALDSDVNSEKKEVQVEEEEGRSEDTKKGKTKKPTARGYASQDSDSDLGLMIVTDSDSQGEGSPVKMRGNQKKVSETIDSSGSKEDKLQLKETDQESTEKKGDGLTEGENDSKVIESAMTGMTLRNRRSTGQAKSSQMSPPPVKRQRTDSEEPRTDKAKMEDKSATDSQKKVTDDSSDITVQAKVPQMTKDSNAEPGKTVAADPAVQSTEDGGAATTRKGAAAKSESEGKGGVLDTLGQIMQLQENLQKFQAEEKQGQVKPSVPRGVVLPRQPSSCPQPAPSGVEQAPHSREQLEYCLPVDLKLCQENLQDYTRPEKHNVVYSLMSFGKLLLLVRSDLPAVSRTPGGHFKWFAHVQSKLEYQPDFGVEQLTPGEMCREWISTYIMPPDSRLIRVRINAFTSEVMLVEQLKHNQILDHRVHFSPGTAMKMLLSVLEKVQSLPPGDFLLTHNPGDVHICIYQSLDSSLSKKGAYDLHTAHQQAAATPTPETRPPWVPLDPSIILPQHWQNGRVPATFEPRPPNPLPVKKWQPQPGKTKGKKKKKSKKT